MVTVCHTPIAPVLTEVQMSVKNALMLDQLAMIMRGMPINGSRKFIIGLFAKKLSTDEIMPFMNVIPLLNATLIFPHSPIKKALMGSQFL